MSNNAPVVIIKKKKHGHGGHHGGAWKVAYADFVTAMMAFFLVMWIIAMDSDVREGIQSYFNDPFGSSSKPGFSQLNAGGASPMATGYAGQMGQGSIFQPGRGSGQARERQKELFREVERSLQKEIAEHPDLGELAAQVDIGIGPDGLVVELVEKRDNYFFRSGSADLPAPTRAVLKLIAAKLGKIPNPVVVEGHTDVVPYSSRADYTNWELSADRANAARRVMEVSGLGRGQVVGVRGLASTRLRAPQQPKDPSNRRVSIIVHYRESAPEVTPAAVPEGNVILDTHATPFQVEIQPMASSEKKPDGHEAGGH